MKLFKRFDYWLFKKSWAYTGKQYSFFNVLNEFPQMMTDDDGYLVAIALCDTGRKRHPRKTLPDLNFNEKPDQSFGVVISAFKNNDVLFEIYSSTHNFEKIGNLIKHRENSTNFFKYRAFIQATFLSYILFAQCISDEAKQIMLTSLKETEYCTSNFLKHYFIADLGGSPEKFVDEFFGGKDAFLAILKR